VVSPSGLVTITGGKWTTYRKMAQDAVDNAVFISKLDKRLCITKNLPIGDPLSVQQKKEKWIQEDQGLASKLHPDFSYQWVDIAYAVRQEMAITVEDVLARRTRFLFLDAHAALDCLEQVALFMQIELNQSNDWVEQQKKDFIELAEGYL
jgi:glycerol-3-phosphate dehydrogenase